MKHSTFSLIATTAVLGLALHTPAALATVPYPYLVSGSVTSLEGGNEISIDGKTYQVQVNSAALSILEQVHVGETVDVVLSGPPNAASSQVIAIHVHNPS